jgi:hypothetical protein
MKKKKKGRKNITSQIQKGRKRKNVYKKHNKTVERL